MLPRNNLSSKLKELTRTCRREGLKITPQRLAIYKELVSSLEHPSACSLYKKVKKILPNISLDTVNRTLLMFNKIGACWVVEGSGDPKRFDGQMEPHHHFRCRICRRIIDYCSGNIDDIKIPRKFQKEFIISNRTIHLEGICAKCSKKEKRNAKESKL